MIRFPVSQLSLSSNQTVSSWNQELRDSMGACWSARPPYRRDPQVFYQRLGLGELSLLTVSVSSSVMYASAPRESSTESERIFFIHMGNTPNRMNLHGKQIMQQPGECMLGDSALHTTSACAQPHSTLCAGVPARMLREYLPDAERFVAKHLDSHSTYSRIVPTLLSSMFRMASVGTEDTNAQKLTSGLLRAFAEWCVVSSCDGAAQTESKVHCEQIKRAINAKIRDPALSVESVAQAVGVSTRYLQLLFAKKEDCVSQYIRRERLKGCLLDLRDAHLCNKDITEIAFSWGFNSASHFSSSFKREYGLSAREYRRCRSPDLSGFPKNGIAELLVLATDPSYS